MVMSIKSSIPVGLRKTVKLDSFLEGVGVDV